MKLATFVRPDGKSSIGAVDTTLSAVLDLQAAALLEGAPEYPFGSMLALIDAGPEGLDRARRHAETWADEAHLSLAEVRLLAPLPRPRQIRDCLGFEEHLINSMRRTAERTGKPQTIADIWYRQPIYYKANRFSVIGTDTDVIWPRYSQWMDFELEMALVIGSTGKDIQPENALDHVFGYTIFNDFTARDAQYAEMEGRLGPAKGKDFDTGNVLGPWIVTRDEIDDPYHLAMDARVNGERWGGGNTSTIFHRFEAMIAHISCSETIYAGEIICSGTVGTGCGNELGRRLTPGDVIELEIDRIGRLRNRIVRPEST